MVSLRFIAQQVNGKDLVLAMAIVQGARYLGTILLQPSQPSVLKEAVTKS